MVTEVPRESVFVDVSEDGGVTEEPVEVWDRDAFELLTSVVGEAP